MIDKRVLKHLYTQGKSMPEIATSMHCSVHKVVYWMKKHNLPRRSHSDAAYQKENPHGDPFHIKKNRNTREQFLYGLSLGLYWGEGTKASGGHARLTNTDPSMIRIFRLFLLKICNVSKQKIHYSLVVFNDVSTQRAALYWAKELGISEDRFGTIVNIPSQGKGSYKKKSQYGVCSITVSNVKLKAWILRQLEELEERLDSSVVKRQLGKLGSRVRFSLQAQKN